MSFDFTTVFILALAAAFALYVFTSRARALSHEYASKIQGLVVELKSKAQNLDKARETALETNDQIERRNAELSSLREEARYLRGLVSKLKEQNDSLAVDAASHVATAEDLRRRLEAAVKAKTRLEKDVHDVQDRHLELVSRLHVDDRERISALNRLRHPHQYHYPSSNDSPGLDGGGTSSTAPSSDTLLPIAAALDSATVAKSPSESFLLGLHPNLAPDGSDDDDSDDDPPVFHHRAKPPPAPLPARPATPPPLAPAPPAPARRPRANGRRAARAPQPPLSLPRAPWADTLGAALSGEAARVSLAHALGAGGESAPGVRTARGDGSASGSGSTE